MSILSKVKEAFRKNKIEPTHLSTTKGGNDMSITAKIDETLRKNNDSPLINEDDLIFIFGEEYKIIEMNLNRKFSCYVFEDNGQLYYFNVLKENNAPISLITVSPGKVYKPLDPQIFSVIAYHKGTCETLLSMDPDNSYTKEKIDYVDKLLNHPSIRLRYLFK